MGFVGEGGEGGEPSTESGDEERAEKDGIGVLALAPNGEECNEEGAKHVYHERNDPAWQYGCVGCGLPNAVAKRGACSSTYCNVNKAYHLLRKEHCRLVEIATFVYRKQPCKCRQISLGY